MALSKEELGKLRQETKQEVKAEKPLKPKSGKKFIFISIFSVFVILIIVGIGYSFVQSGKPGPLDDFAKCLNEKGAVIYGASFCKYTGAQRGMFGKSDKYLDYKDYTEDSSIKITPTWKINGQYYQSVQSMERLAALTGCHLG